ncbi:hypothetical protein AB0J35_32165 [Nonomuraea angiospora]|uniref:hypothetical protein n=1 Tax=Nonomuraea angiospora TaxID=46172 RepID=UPI00341D5019
MGTKLLDAEIARYYEAAAIEGVEGRALSGTVYVNPSGSWRNGFKGGSGSFGFFGTIAARDQAGAQEIVAVAESAGRAVTGWGRDARSRCSYEPSSRLLPPPRERASRYGLGGAVRAWGWRGG